MRRIIDIETARGAAQKFRPRSLVSPIEPRCWYRINALTGGRAEIYVYDMIGDWGVSADDFVRELAALDADEIDVRINSDGGDYFDGVAIYNALVGHRASITTYADGRAASAASIVFMAGERRVTRRASRVMVHRASTFAYGNANDLQEMVELMRSLDSDMAGVYSETAGGTVDDWLARMDAETWYSASESVDVGLATETEGDSEPARKTGGSSESDPAEAHWNSAEILGILKGAAA